jgi:transposase
MSKKITPKCVELTGTEILDLKSRVCGNKLTEEDSGLIVELIDFSLWLLNKMRFAQITLYKLRKILFGNKSEKGNNSSNKSKGEQPDKDDMESSNAQGETAANDKQSSPHDVAGQDDKPNSPSPEAQRKSIIKGHGRMGSDAYTPDETIKITHSQLTVGDLCPSGCGGRLYEFAPGSFLQIKGRTCAKVIHYIIDKLRCAKCGEVFTADLPIDFPMEKYDARFKAMLAAQKYYVATPFYRQESYQKLLGFPLPDSTQWDLVEQVADCVYPVLAVLEKEAANGTLIHNDDTTVKILDVMRNNKLNPDKERTGMFTSCIFSTTDARKICIYRSGTDHAGENLADILKNRDKDLSPIIHMCDALSANIPADFKTILCNCMAHGRRKFVEIEPFFPKECGYVIDQLALIYKHDKETKEQKMSADERLKYHQKHSNSVMEELKLWLHKQFDERLVEPNSALGSAIKYLQRHWPELTKFLSVAGAPLDNNIVERALKLAIRIRKNSMFHKSKHGAYVAGLLLSLIYTCALAEKNPIDYLTALQEHKSHVFKQAHLWLPWNYESTLDALATLKEKAA